MIPRARLERLQVGELADSAPSACSRAGSGDTPWEPFLPAAKPLFLFVELDVLRRHPTEFPVAPLDHRVASFLVTLARLPHRLDQGRIDRCPFRESTINRVQCVIRHHATPAICPHR